MSSRDIESLKPSTKAMVLDCQAACLDEGLDMLWYCFHRPVQEQAILFRQGRSLERIKHRAHRLSTDYGRSDLAQVLMSAPPQMGKRVVTRAAPGQSLHNYRMAGDAVPLIMGKPIWLDGTTPEEESLWHQYGALAEDAGLKWAGNWTKGREFPHVQEGSYGWRDRIETYDFKA